MREGEDRWKGHPVLSIAIGVAVVVLPIAVSVGAALLVEWRVPQPDSVVGFGLWWLAVLALCTAVFVAADRIARRALPLAVLLKMNMVFPGQAPRRLAAARRAGSVRDLSRQVAEARTRGVADEPTRAAEGIVVLAASMSAHDRTTRGHAERVRALTDMIAAELRIPEGDRERLRWSALLHDIGKLTVHPDVLNKPGKLSETEWRVIREHPLQGARLTAPIAGWLGPWSQTIAEHHERFDGSGYPFGKAGRQISLGGRIVAVADTYDVMTSARSYKSPVSPQRARAELTACAGSQFDPEVVKAFLAVSLWRLRAAAPLSWLGSASFGRLFAGLGRVGTVGGHSVLAAVVAGAGVAGLAVADPASPVTHQTPVVTEAAGGAGPSHRPDSGSVGGTGGGGSSPSASAGSSGSNATGSKTSGAQSGGASTTTTTKAGDRSTTTTTTKAGERSTTTTTTGSGGGSGGKSTTTTSPPTTTTTTPPVPTLLEIENGPSGNSGRPEAGDQIIVTYSVAPAASDFCAAWTPTSHSDLVGPGVVINANQPNSGDDVILSVTDSSGCSGGFHFGSIDLGERGFFNNAQTIGGAGGQCSASNTSGCTRIHWDGSHTLTITLGEPQNGEPTQKTPAVAIYSPDPALGVSGTISSAKAVEF